MWLRAWRFRIGPSRTQTQALLLAVSLWADYLISLRFSPFTCEVGVITVPLPLLWSSHQAWSL